MTVDLAIFQPDGSGALFTATSGGSVVSGPQKVAQRFAILLFTETGSVGYRSARGVNFLNEAIDGFLSEMDAYSAFYSSSQQVGQQMQQDESGQGLPSNEEFQDSIITSVTIAPGSASASITIVTQANTLAGITLPLTFNV